MSSPNDNTPQTDPASQPGSSRRLQVPSGPTQPPSARTPPTTARSRTRSTAGPFRPIQEPGTPIIFLKSFRSKHHPRGLPVSPLHQLYLPETILMMMRPRRLLETRSPRTRDRTQLPPSWPAAEPYPRIGTTRTTIKDVQRRYTSHIVKPRTGR